MNKNTLGLLNKVKNDTLIKLSDNVNTLIDYLSRYYGINLDDKDASALFKALQTMTIKANDKRKADKAKNTDSVPV